VSAVLGWIAIRGASPGPLFRFKSGTPLTRQLMVDKLKEALVAAGISPRGFSGHSFRAGAATTAAKIGMEDLQIRLLGKWKSDAYHRYIKPSGSHLATLASSCPNLRDPAHSQNLETQISPVTSNLLHF